MKECESYLLKKGFIYSKIKNGETFCENNNVAVTFYNSENEVDSVQVITSKKTTLSVFNMNDCFLNKNILTQISKEHNIRHSMVFFMGVGPYPGSFDLSQEVKKQIIKKKEISDYRALKTMQLLKLKLFLPIRMI